MTDPRYFTVAELSATLRVKPHTVLAWIRAGELRAVDVSRHPGTGKPRWRIPAEAVAE